MFPDYYCIEYQTNCVVVCARSSQLAFAPNAGYLGNYQGPLLVVWDKCVTDLVKAAKTTTIMFSGILGFSCGNCRAYDCLGLASYAYICRTASAHGSANNKVVLHLSCDYVLCAESHPWSSKYVHPHCLFSNLPDYLVAAAYLLPSLVEVSSAQDLLQPVQPPA